MNTTMARQAFEDAVALAQPGTRITYHIGFIMEDRSQGATFMAVDNVAHAAFEAAERGAVHLAQRRIALMQYEYMAIKRPGPHKPVVWRGCYKVEQPIPRNRTKVAA